MADGRQEIRGPRTFAGAVSICLNRYFQMAGRAPRSEYWYFVLFTMLAQIVAGIVDAVFGDFADGVVGALVTLALLIPSITVWVRRLHDIDRSGWWWLLVFIPVVGWIIMLIWTCTRGTDGPNRYGPDPLGGSTGWGPAVAA